MDFVLRAYTTGKSEPIPKATPKIATNPSSSSNGELAASGSSSKGSSERSQIEIQNILDVLPHLEVSFIQKLLTRYENAESAIAAVLEGNLPPDLDETIQIESPTTETKVNKDVEKCTVMLENQHLGGENKEIVNIKMKTQLIRPKAEKRFLDDKSAIKEFHARNIEHGYIDMPDEYDDEYDDSYDAVVESESKALKILKNTGAINELVDEIDDSEESESDDDAATGAEQRDRGRDFCENPELARERWARNREAKYGNKRPSRPAA